nr:hypothetical protein CFP56_12213 [Quercus suber]
MDKFQHYYHPSLVDQHLVFGAAGTVPRDGSKPHTLDRFDPMASPSVPPNLQTIQCELNAFHPSSLEWQSMAPAMMPPSHQPLQQTPQMASGVTRGPVITSPSMHDQEHRESSACKCGKKPPPSLMCFEHGCNGRRFSSVENYRRHMREKNVQRFLRCAFCNTSFTRNSNLMQHLRQGKCQEARQICNDLTDMSGNHFGTVSPQGYF